MGQDLLVAALEPALAQPASRWLRLRVEEVGGPNRDRLLLAQHEPADLGVGRPRRRAVQALQIILQLLRDGRVALVAEGVVDGLGGDDLPDGRHQWRVAELAPDTGYL